MSLLVLGLILLVILLVALLLLGRQMARL